MTQAMITPQVAVRQPMFPMPDDDTLRRVAFTAAGAVATALAPALPYIVLCTAVIVADCYTAWQLSRRVARAYPELAAADRNSGKFRSSGLRQVLVTLAETYALLVSRTSCRYM